MTTPEPAAQPAGQERGATGRNLGARLAALSTPAKPARPARGTTSSPRRTGRQDTGRGARQGTRRTTAAPPPAEQSSEPVYGERLSITTTIQQIQALRMARAADGIQATARLRALIAAWMDDPKLRERIDRAARDWTDRPPAR